MGKEAVVEAQIGAEAGTVRVLLESTELIVRGDIRRRFSRSSLVDIAADGDVLRLACDGETVVLKLGATAAVRWAAAISTSPPTLKTKLGFRENTLAFCSGVIEDSALADAVSGALTQNVGEADVILACIKNAADLNAALAIHARRPSVPLWTIYAKGKGAAFAEREVRTALRAKGYRDTKSCAVSEALTACRYNLGQSKA